MTVYEQMNEYIKEGNIEKSVSYALDLMKNKTYSIVALYEDVLGKILNEIDCKQSDEDCIWYEHQRTAIVRTIVDALFPFLMEERQDLNGKKVLVVCPSEEYHELGAKMAADFFYLLGYETTFVGANTPTKTILSALRTIKPDYLAISVTNYYHLVTVKKLVELAREELEHLVILGGGRAFKHKGAKDVVGVDACIGTYEDIAALEGTK